MNTFLGDDQQKLTWHEIASMRSSKSAHSLMNRSQSVRQKKSWRRWIQSCDQTGTNWSSSLCFIRICGMEPNKQCYGQMCQVEPYAGFYKHLWQPITKVETICMSCQTRHIVQSYTGVFPSLQWFKCPGKFPEAGPHCSVLPRMQFQNWMSVHYSHKNLWKFPW